LSRSVPGWGWVQSLTLNRSAGNVPKELVQLIKEMTHKDPARRPGVIVAAQRMNKILFAQAEKEGLKVCTLSIRAFLSADVQKRQKFIRDVIANKINAVALTALSADGVTLKDYYQVRYELMKAGIINVSPFMARGATQEANIRVVKDHYDGMYATVHTTVLQYQNGKLFDKTPSAEMLAIETPSYTAVKKVVEEHKKELFTEMNHVMKNAKYIVGAKKKDLEVILKLPPLKNAEDFVPFVRALETAYLNSLKSAKTLFGPKVTEAMMNKAPNDKYVLQRTLGRMLKTVYEQMDEAMGLAHQDVKRRVPGVMNLESFGKVEKKLEAKNVGGVKYKRL